MTTTTKLNFANSMCVMLPLVAVYATGMACPVPRASGSMVKFRPPAVVFSVVWPILLLLFGMSFMLARVVSPWYPLFTYGSTVILLCIWMFIYGCRRRKDEAIWVIVLTIMCTLLSIVHGTTLSRSLAVPILTWLMFALIISTTEMGAQLGV